MSDMITLRQTMAARIAEAIATLLEQKHLYQSVAAFDLDQFIDAEMPARKMPPENSPPQFFRTWAAVEAGRGNLRRAACLPWLPLQSEEGRLEADARQQQATTLTDIDKSLLFEFPFVRLFCKRCDRREPYRPLSVEDAFRNLRPTPDPARDPVMINQIFIALYQCQGCRSAPEFIAVARNEMKVRLVGRHPIENVEVSADLPRQEAALFRSARIAFNTGNVLAAVFYLRTFIEQFARRKTNTTGRKPGDVLMGEYNATLPEDLRGRMPSLAEWYEKLSEALHEARDDEDLFRAAEEKILYHFELRNATRLD